MTFSTLLTVSLLSLTSAVECVRYGNNHVPVRRDNEAVAANFQDVEGFELIAPAFTMPDGIPAEFANGTEGPTDDATMGMFYDKRTYVPVLTLPRLLSAIHSLSQYRLDDILLC